MTAINFYPEFRLDKIGFFGSQINRYFWGVEKVGHSSVYFCGFV